MRKVALYLWWATLFVPSVEPVLCDATGPPVRSCLQPRRSTYQGKHYIVSMLTGRQLTSFFEVRSNFILTALHAILTASFFMPPSLCP